MISGTFEGAEFALSQLRLVDDAVQKKALAKIAAAGSSRLAKAVKSMVPRRQPRSLPRSWSYAGNQLKRSIGRKVKRYSGAAVGIVGARVGFRIQVGVLTRDGPAGSRKQGKAGDPVFVDPTKYLHLVLLGTPRMRGTNFFEAAGKQESSAIVADAAKIVVDAIRGTL